MRKRITSLLLTLVMLLSLLPTTALATDSHPAAEAVLVDGKYFGKPGKLYYKNNDTAETFTGTATDYNAAYDETTGVLTLQDYKGGSIIAGGATTANITIKLVGDNFVTGSVSSDMGGDITITSDSSGTLSITNTLSGSNAAIGIETGLSASNTTGNVTIKGNAKVTINMTHNGTLGWDNAYGIYAKDNITISENASVDITCATPNNTTGGDHCNGLYAAKNDVIINTTGKIKINVANAGKDDAYSYGIYPMGKATLTKVGEMEVQWKKHATHSSYPGGVVYKGASLSDTDYAINEDTTNCYASYRKGTPYTVMVENGTLAGTGVVSHANNNGNFLAGDTVEIKPSVMKGKSGEEIPFQKWTSKDVMLTSPTAENNSFTVPANAVTVTAKHNPFVGAPTFTPKGTTRTEGTLTFTTVVDPYDGSEGFYLVKEEDVDTTSKYISINPSKTSTGSPYEYSSTVNFNIFPAGNYYVAEKLNGAWYLSEKFKVDYNAASTPTATVGNVTIDGTTSTAITAAEVKITLTNDKFKAIAATTDVKSWFTNLPAGLEAKIKTAVNDNDTTATIEISGTPSVASSAPLAITIPAANLASGSALDVTSNSSAVFAITDPATPIAAPTANTGLVYDGTEKTGVTESAGYTLTGTYKATNVGTANYTATATLNTGYTWNDGSIGDKTITWNIGKRTPTATDFNFAAPVDLIYDGSDKTASITLKSPLTKSGAITVKYEKDSASVTETKDVGTYTVKIDVAAGDNFNAGSDLNNPAWKFSITPANQSAPTGLGVAAPIASGGNGKITGTTDKMEYNTDAAAATGWTACSATETEVAPDTYYVRLKADANHNAGTVSAALVVPAYGATPYSITVNNDGNGTVNADKTSAVAGETVTLTATPNSGYVFDEWVEKTPAGLTIGADGKFTMPGENVSVKATFKPAALTGTASITGTLKFNEELTATLTGGNNTGTLTYKWYRGSDEIIGATGSTYTLVEDDIGKTITVKVSSTVQTGEIPSAATAAVGKADGPMAPTAFTLTFTLNADGTTFTATIPAFAGGEYSFDGTNYSATNTKADCAANSSYTGYVRIAATSTHEASAATSSTQTSPKLTVATPTFTPNGASSFTGPQSVTITCATTGAKIYYTTDGTTPTTTSTEYTTALSLTSTTTVKAIAVNAGMNDSAIATATFIKYSGGGGGGGGSYTPSYTVSVDKTENGTITVSPKSASKGDTVTITVKPDKGYELEMLKALDKDGDALKLTEKNGKYTFKMPSGKVTVKGSFVEEAPVQIFKDVPVDAYYYEAVKWAAEKGITGGVGNGLFAPNQPCTRAQIVTFLWRAAGSPAPKSMSSFADVPADAFYAKAVAWAVENGITGGTGDGKFSPDATCTRAQSVTFLYRAAGSPKVSSSAEFGDVATNAYYADAVAWAAKNGITGGIGGGLFGSGNDCTRAQIVTFLYRNYQSK